MTVTATTKTELWAPIGTSAVVLTNEAKWYPSPVYTPAPPPPHQCPHGCGRDRHPEPLTRDVAFMYDNHHFREDYDPAEDDSPIVCIGSNYQGPRHGSKYRTPTPPSFEGFHSIGVFVDNGPFLKMQGVLQSTLETLNKICGDWKMPAIEPIDWPLWFMGTPEPLEPCDTPEGVTVTFGNDWQPWNHAMPGEIKANIKLAEHIRTHRNDFPIPKSPGYDFSKYAEEQTTPYWIGALK